MWLAALRSRDDRSASTGFQHFGHSHDHELRPLTPQSAATKPRFRHLSESRRAAKRSCASLYNHIPSAEQLQNQLTIFALQALRDEIARAAIGTNGSERVLAIGHAYRTFAKDHPGMYAVTLRAPRQDDVALQRIAGEVLDIIRAILVPFGLSENMNIHAIRGFRSIVHGFVTLEAGHGFGLPQSIDDSFAFIMQSFIAALDNANRVTRRPQGR